MSAFSELRGAVRDMSRYHEAIVLLKQTQDLSWNASALEGMAVAGVIDAWWAEQNSVISKLSTHPNPD